MNSLSVHLVKAKRELRKIAPAAGVAGQQRLQLLDIVEGTQRLRRAYSLSEFEATLAQLRDNLQAIDSTCKPDHSETD